jgi:hypothetical protein
MTMRWSALTATALLMGCATAPEFGSAASEADMRGIVERAQQSATFAANKTRSTA